MIVSREGQKYSVGAMKAGDRGGMNTTKLAVGQEVLLFGIGYILGKVISIVPSIDVQSEDGFLRFGNDGIETDQSRYLRNGVLNGPGPEWEPWEIVATTPEEMASVRKDLSPEFLDAWRARFAQQVKERDR